MSATPTEARRARPGLFRYVGIGVACVELAYLIAWLGLLFGLLDDVAPHLLALSPILLDSLPALFTGMAVAALLGAAAGLAVAVVRRVANRLGPDRVQRPPG